MEEQEQLQQLEATLKELKQEVEKTSVLIETHQKTIENFRTSFQNLESMIYRLMERNRLR